MSALSKNQEDVQTVTTCTFPRPGTTLYSVITDTGYRQAFRAKIKQGNRWIVPLYRLGIMPLLGFSRQVMLLTTRGRKSRMLRSTPIGYFRVDQIITLFSGWGKQADWFKNMLACPDEVFIQIGFHRRHVIPEIVDDPARVQQTLERLIRQDPRGARTLMGWDPAHDLLETSDFSLMLEKVLVIRFHAAENRA